MTTLFRAACILTLSLNTACACLHRPNLPWRTTDRDTGASANPDDCAERSGNSTPRVLEQLANKDVQASVRCASAEHYTDPNTGTTFDLHVIEFDDQGRFWNRAQAEQALEDVRTARKAGDVLVITFFHGWFNNGDVCNGKLSCFRELMSLIAEAEISQYRRQLQRSASTRETPPRKVIGIFGAWRGETLAVKGAKFVTFWGRKATAHTVGENGAVTELVARLFRVVHRIEDGGDVPAAPTPDLSSLVAIGHSFGGALLMSAIGNELNRAAGEALAGGNAAPVTNRMADLVVLVNPAVEASRFDNLREAASAATFNSSQLPLLLTLSSEKDTPNQILFPIGQSIAFAQKAARSREQWQGMIQSLGTFRPNQTHQLIARGSPPSHRVRVAHCQCDSGIAQYRDLLLDALLNQAGEAGDLPPTAPRREYLFSRLEPMQDTAPNNPFFMVQVDDRVIGGHSDIFNPRTVDFLLEFMFRTEVRRSSVRLGTPQIVRSDDNRTAVSPPSQQAAQCFEVRRSPDGPVSIVHLRDTLSRRARTVGIDYVGPGSGSNRATARIERFLDEKERQFPFTFTQEEGKYVLTMLDEPAPGCHPFEHPVRPLRESKPTRAYMVVGLADGLGAQIGGTLQLSHFAFDASIIKKARASLSELTTDVGLGYRGNRSVVGAGHRWRHDFDRDVVASRSVYTHFTLELPGVRFLKQTWSSWMGIEFTPAEWRRESNSWERDANVAVRLQLKLPRESWLSQ